MTKTIFRVSFEYLAKNTDGVPIFLPIICNFLKENSESVGIFRIPGDFKNIEILSENLAKFEPEIPLFISVNDAADCLKRWLRELPIPILTPSILNSIESFERSNWQIHLLAQLDDSNRRSIANIFSLLKKVLENKHKNLMGSNLDLCFVTSFTQNNKDLKSKFPFWKFYECTIQYLNPNQTDFVYRSDMSMTTYKHLRRKPVDLNAND